MSAECHEGIIRKGIDQPCDKPAVAERWDEREEFPGWYPVCARHTRGRCRPLGEDWKARWQEAVRHADEAFAERDRVIAAIGRVENALGDVHAARFDAERHGKPDLWYAGIRHAHKLIREALEAEQ